MTRLLSTRGVCLAAGFVACLSERPRPGPPSISISLDKTTVQSGNPPDTLVVGTRVVDPEGIDSVWAQLAGEAPIGVDGRFDDVLEGFFRIAVPAGQLPGSSLPVVVRARDVGGFESHRDTTVRVGP